MPEAGGETRPEEAAAGPAEGTESPEPAGARVNWFYYSLGLALQTFLWFLLFLAITVAVLVGNKLTEFRYVGF